MSARPLSGGWALTTSGFALALAPAAHLARPDEDGLPGLDGQGIGLVAGQLGDQHLAALQAQVDPHLPAEMDDALDHGGQRRTVLGVADLDVVRAHHRVTQVGDRADEAHHELVDGLLVELARAAGLLDRALMHDDHGVGDLHRLLLVVRDDHRRHVHLVVQAAQPLAQVLADAGVERAERLVQQQHLGLDGQCAGQRHALPLAARELRRVAVAQALQVDQVDQLGHPVLDLGLRPAPDLQAERDVLGDGHVLERRIVLEHEADAPLVRGQRGHVPAAQADGAGVGLLEPSDHPQQRGLAAAAGAEQRGQRAVGDLERDVVEGHEVPELFGHIECVDRHHASWRGLNMVMRSTVESAIRASTTDAA